MRPLMLTAATAVITTLVAGVAQADTIRFWTTENQPMTENEIYDWFEGFNNFQTRKDVDEYLVDDNRLEGVPGITLLKSFGSF